MRWDRPTRPLGAARERRLRLEALASTLGLGIVAACVLLVAPRDSAKNRRGSWPLVSEPFGVGPVSRSQIPLLATPVLGCTRRARYRAGRVGGRDVSAYVDEDGVAPEHRIETFAEVVLELDSWRWSGTRFRLRTGKALARDRKEIVVRFRPVPHHPVDLPRRVASNLLRFELDPEGVTLDLTGTVPGVALNLVPLTLHAEMEPPELSAYGRILLERPRSPGGVRRRVGRPTRPR